MEAPWRTLQGALYVLVLLHCSWSKAENVALRKPAEQLGTLNGHTADLAVDGLTDAHDPRQGSCAHPYSLDPNLDPDTRRSPTWWRVDLGAGSPDRKYDVTSVSVYNGLDCCPNLLVPATVRVSADDTDVTRQYVCGEVTEAAPVVTVRCTPPFPVRYVSVVATRSREFTLCEVRVEGRPHLPGRDYEPTLVPSTSAGSPSLHLVDVVGITVAGVVLVGIIVGLLAAALTKWRRRSKTSPEHPGQQAGVLSLRPAVVDPEDPSIQLQTLSSYQTNTVPNPDPKRTALVSDNKAAFKRLGKLLDKVPVAFPVQRTDLVESMLLIYKDHASITQSPLRVEFTGEQGVDWGGPTRELFTTFWDQVTTPGPQAYFKGSDVVVPSIPLHRMRTETWKFLAIGRILSHTAALAKFIPQKIARSCYVSIIFGSTVDHKCLLKDYLKFLPEEDRRLVKKAIMTYEDLSQAEVDELIEFYSRNGLQVLPKSGDVRHQVINIAEQQLIRDPRDLCEMIRKGIPEDHYNAFWSHMTLGHVTAQLRHQMPTGEDLTNHIITPPQVSRRETRVLTYLRQYLVDLDRPHLTRFLAFVTGSHAFPHDPIAVTFTDLKGVQRRPIAQTCANNLMLSVYYTSYEDFKTEMDQYLNSKYSYDFSVC